MFPRAYYVSEGSGLRESKDDEMREEDLCCVCKEFTPDLIRKSASLLFTKWVQCTSCFHWVHLGICTEKRVVSLGDNFLCIHCE